MYERSLARARVCVPSCVCACLCMRVFIHVYRFAHDCVRGQRFIIVCINPLHCAHLHGICRGKVDEDVLLFDSELACHHTVPFRNSYLRTFIRHVVKNQILRHRHIWQTGCVRRTSINKETMLSSRGHIAVFFKNARMGINVSTTCGNLFEHST